MVAPVDEATRQRLLATFQRELRRCRLCVEAGYLMDAYPVFQGNAASRVMVVGQAPAARNVERPVPYSGASGRTLRAWLDRAGFDPDALHTRFYLTSLTKCFPGSSASGKGDRAPSPAEIALCRPHLERELALVQPNLILPLGRLAITYFVGKRPLSALVGQLIRRGDAYVLPLPHPSGVSHWLNDAANRALLDAALDRLGELRVELGIE
jgi:uracil-DNA glycosylase family 4